MIISHTHRFIFVHVAKTAGRSVKRALRPYRHNHRQYLVNRLLAKVGIRVNHFGPYRRKRFRVHESARTLRRCLPEHVFSSYFKFAFVRNPWDLIVSRYCHLIRNPEHQHHTKVRKLGSFERFLEFTVARDHGHQHSRLTDRDGTLLVDFLGRFERLQADFARICQRIGVDVPLGHEHRSQRDHYSAYYNARTQAMIAEHYSQDIEMFGYAFEVEAQVAP